MKNLVITILAMFVMGIGFGQNVSALDQTGANHNAEVTQTGTANDSYISQMGDGNEAIISQLNFATGDNVSNVYQEDESNTVSSDQTNTGFASTNDSYIEQFGIGNDATLTQNGTLNQSVISQNQLGSLAGNSAFVNQSGLNGSSDVNQSGNSNVADLNQSGYGAFSTVTQLGQGNFSLVNSNGTSGVPPGPLLVDVPAGYFVSASSDQTGTNGYSEVYQDGNNLASDITQFGVIATFGGAYTNYATVFQSDLNSESLLNQTAESFVFAENIATVNQSGFGEFGNQSDVLQTGANSVNVNQNSGLGPLDN